MANQLAVITGASSGIGAEFARQLAAQGCDLVLVARRAARLQQVADELAGMYGVAVEIRPTDLADSDQTNALASHLSQLPKINYLINNAGLGVDMLIVDSDVTQQLAMLHVHINAPFLLSRAVLPNMIAQRQGNIINVSSIAGFMTGPKSVNYCASKAYLTSFSESLQKEVREYGVKVQALCPGYTVTAFHDTDWMVGFERENVPSGLWDSAEFVVTTALNHLRPNSPVVIIPGRKNQLLVASAQNKLLIRARAIAKRTVQTLLTFRKQFVDKVA